MKQFKISAIASPTEPRIETADRGNLLSTRCRASELCFVSNPKLEQAILGYAAKFVDRYGVSLYELTIEGL